MPQPSVSGASVRSHRWATPARVTCALWPALPLRTLAVTASVHFRPSNDTVVEVGVGVAGGAAEDHRLAQLRPPIGELRAVAEGRAPVQAVGRALAGRVVAQEDAGRGG